jgi:hypothetical protein
MLYYELDANCFFSLSPQVTVTTGSSPSAKVAMANTWLISRSLTPKMQ